MKVYRVIGITGEYGDFEEWSAKCFIDEDKARAYVNECKTFAEWLMQDDNVNEECEIYPRYYSIEKHRELSPDENIKVDYTGTSYYIEELKVEE